MITFSITDIIVVSTYFVIVLMISLLVARRKQESINEYFFANNKLSWFSIGVSLFISHISVAYFVGFLNNVWSPLFLEWLTIPVILLLGWVFAPIFLKLNVRTVPEVFEIIYDRIVRKYVSIISMVFYVLVRISITLFAGSILFNKFFHWNTSTSIIIMLIFTGFYVVVSGFRAIVYTQVFQAIVVLIGAAGITLVGMFGTSYVSAIGPQILQESQFLLKPWSNSDVPLIGIIFGAPVIIIWYWCMDQYIVQRIFSAKSVEKARSATILAGFLTFIFIVIFTGFCFIVKGQGSANPETMSLLGQYSFMTEYPGVMGGLLIIFISLMMSSLSSTINSAATLFALDIYKPKHPEASERKVVLVGRLISMVIVIVGIFSLPLLKSFTNNAFIHLLVIMVYIAPPIVALFLGGIFSKKVNAIGAIWTLRISAVLISIKILSDFKILGFDEIYFLNFHYLNFAVILFALSMFTLFVVSLITSSKLKPKYSQSMLDIKYNLSDIIAGLNVPRRLNALLSIFLTVITIGLWMILI